MHKAFAPLYTSKDRYFFLTGGRGSLKSSNVHEFVIELCRFQPGHGVLFTRYTMASAEKSIIPEFQVVADRMGVANEFHITKNVVTHKRTGSFIYFSGIKASSGDQTAKLKSLAGITTWIVEEGEDFKSEKTFEIIDDSIRTTAHQNRVIFIMNPTTKEHFIYNKWITTASKQIEVEGYNVTVSAVPGVTHIHTTYHIGKEYLAKDWLEKAERYRLEAATRHELPEDHPEYQDKYDSHYYNNYIGGWRERAEGVIFTNWEEGEFNWSLPYCYGADFGVDDPSTLIAVGVDNKRKLLYWKEEFYLSGLDSNELYHNITTRLRRKRDLVVADNAEKREIIDLRKKGVNIIPCRKGPDSIRNGIRKVKGFKIIVHPGSKNLKTELNNYAWNDKKSDTPIDDFNHLIDAGRYATDFLTLKQKGGKRGGARRAN